ncbi:hypothetical protein CFP56_039023 [Quercus suber]|uniref:RanBP2-type domain-containing protein n=1 Tax=Quercus suber TaxID=58331 RepID=A0AAW0J1R0_QUESU
MKYFIYHLIDCPQAILQECDELLAKGITGTGKGFDLPGKRLGGFSYQPPLASLRQTALAAAENRARRGALLPSGPNRVGGDSNIKAALSPIQAAAMAAERRLHDDLWCGSKSLESNTDLNKGIGSSLGPFDGVSTRTSSMASMPGQGTVDGQATWKCNTCTLLNQPLALICEACGTPKLKETANFKVWSCKFCTLDNSVNLERCLACGEWRYSYGPPTSARGPYVGT